MTMRWRAYDRGEVPRLMPELEDMTPAQLRQQQGVFNEVGRYLDTLMLRTQRMLRDAQRGYCELTPERLVSVEFTDVSVQRLPYAGKRIPWTQEQRRQGWKLLHDLLKDIT